MPKAPQPKTLEAQPIALAWQPESRRHFAVGCVDGRVEIHSTSRADMNGKRGIATDFHIKNIQDSSTWRYTVDLDDGEAFKLKRENVRAVGCLVRLA